MLFTVSLLSNLFREKHHLPALTPGAILARLSNWKNARILVQCHVHPIKAGGQSWVQVLSLWTMLGETQAGWTGASFASNNCLHEEMLDFLRVFHLDGWKLVGQGNFGDWLKSYSITPLFDSTKKEQSHHSNWTRFHPQPSCAPLHVTKRQLFPNKKSWKRWIFS